MGFLQNVFLGAILGFAGCLYYLAAAKRRKAARDGDSAVKGHVLYLNFTLVDASEAVKNGVEEKLTSKLGSGFLRDRFAARIGKIAANRVSDETVIKKMSQRMQELMPARMGEMGLQASVSKVFSQENVFILKLTIISADVEKLVGKAAGAEKADKLKEMMQVLGGQWAKDTVNEGMLPLIASTIETKLPVKMREQFDQKGLQCDVVCKPEASQAEFFFATLLPALNGSGASAEEGGDASATTADAKQK